MNKKYFIVIDTETANNIAQPLPYDISWAVTDKKGTIYETYSFLVYEIYCKEKSLMNSAYYANKIPEYEEQIKNGEKIVASIYAIKERFETCCKKYNIDTVYAYNITFDKKALNNDIRYISKSFARWFFPFGINFYCIWNIACNLLMSRKSFISFAEENNFISPAGNILTNAEVCYRYITGDIDFQEEHKGLEDVLIEIKILAYCFRQKKKMQSEPNTNCWRIVQKKRKEIRERV